jgi:hypothetical protein
MPYCPNCKTEYRLGFTTCSDCGSQLVVSLPPEQNGEDIDQELVSIFDPPDPLICHSLAALLEDNGIRCVIKSEEIPMYDGVAGMLRNRWGRLLVLERDREKAELLINEYLSAPAQEEGSLPQEGE